MKVTVAVLAAFVMVALPLGVTLLPSSSDEDLPEPREGFGGWLDANTLEAQRTLTEVSRTMGSLEGVVASSDAEALPAARSAGRDAILEAQELWQPAPPHEARRAILGALDAYLAAVEGAGVGEEADAGTPSTDAQIDAAREEMVGAIEQVQVVAAGGS